MQFWEMDFGQLGTAFEFFVIVDRGTSILVDTQSENHYNAESSLLALAQSFLLNGLPHKIRCDNDSRFVGSWLRDEYPSPMMRFLLCLGVEPDLAEPGKPYLKPFVERNIRTLKHECLWE
jgi:transposase